MSREVLIDIDFTSFERPVPQRSGDRLGWFSIQELPAKRIDNSRQKFNPVHTGRRMY